MGFRAFHEPDFPPSQIRLCVAGFMTRFASSDPTHSTQHYMLWRWVDMRKTVLLFSSQGHG
jgi:hypothetical protein